MESFDCIVQKNTGITVIISVGFATAYTPFYHLRILRKRKRIVGFVHNCSAYKMLLQPI